MNKYIIKNCPAAFNTKDNATYCLDHEITLKNTRCQHITNCLLKQIVEKCKDTNYHYVDGVIDLQNDILQLMDIDKEQQ